MIALPRMPPRAQARALHALPFLAVVIAYFLVETRYPALNNDDTYLLGWSFPASGRTFWHGGLYGVPFILNGGTNEFRTYALARIAQFVIYELAGADIVPYYWVMATIAAGAATLASRTVWAVTRSRAAALATLATLLLGPFSLLQTFHHAAYTLMPFAFACAYGWLLTTSGPGARSRPVLGPLLCTLVVLSGEVVTMVLFAGIAALVAHALWKRDRVQLVLLLRDLGCAVAALLVLYLHWRLFLFDPALGARFEVRGLPGVDAVLAAFNGFQTTIFEYLGNARLEEILSTGVSFDSVAAAAITIAAIGVVSAIVMSSEATNPKKKPLAIAALVAGLYLVSLASYVFLAAVEHGVAYPARYLHVSGMLALIFGCVLCSLAPPIPRRALLTALVVACASNGILTYAVKVPTIEAAHDDLKRRIAAAQGSGVVAFDTPASAGGYLNPYFLTPATTPFTGWWILQNYCPMTMHVQCIQGAGRPGDVVIKATHERPGYLAESSVELRR